MKNGEWPVIIDDIENQIQVLRSDGSLLNFLKNNDPVTCGYVALEKRDSDYAAKAFEDEKVAFVTVSWQIYAEALGRNPFPDAEQTPGGNHQEGESK